MELVLVAVIHQHHQYHGLLHIIFTIPLRETRQIIQRSIEIAGIWSERHHELPMVSHVHELAICHSVRNQELLPRDL